MTEITADLRKGGGLVNYFAGNIVAANLMMVLMLIGGAISVVSLNTQLFPNISPGTITVSVPYPGATPAETSEAIVKRAEQAVLGIEGVEKVSSRASENYGALTIELQDFVDEDKVKDDIEAAISQISDFPPLYAEEPDIQKFETTNQVMTLVVSSDGSERYLKEGAADLENALLSLPSVTLVSMLGARDYEISIEVSESALRQYGMTIDEVANAIRASSVNIGAGEIKTDSGDLLLRTDTKRQTGEEFEDIVIRSGADGSLLRLSDVADVYDGFADTNLRNEFENRPSILLRVNAAPSEDLLQIANDIKSFLGDYKPLPGINVNIWSDESQILEGRLSLLIRNGLLGFALVFLFLVLMLDLRLAIWVAMGVPISFFGAFLFFDFLNVDITMISLFGLIIVLGIVVDDAIVVGENIVAEQERGHEGVVAAKLGVEGVKSPVTIGVLTTMAAFAPLLFVTGPFGQILGVVSIIVICVLIMSLVEAFFILPAHLAHGGSWSRPPLDHLQQKVSKGLEYVRDTIVLPLIGSAIRYRYRTLTISIIFFILSISLVVFGTVRFVFFPSIESDNIQVSIAFPIGTPFEQTEKTAETIVEAAYRLNKKLEGTAFESISVTIGGNTTSGGGPGGGSNVNVAGHLASIIVQLQKEPIRTLSAKELERRWRAEVGDIAGAESISYVSDIFNQGQDIVYEFSHLDDETLLAAIEIFKQSLSNLPAVYDVQDSFKLGKNQYDVELTEIGKAAGLNSSMIARQLRMNFYGEEVQRIQRGRDELRVMVRYPRNERRSRADLYNSRIRLLDGTETSLRTVANLTETRSYSTIESVDGKRIVRVTAELDEAINTPGEVFSVIETELLPALEETYRGLTYSKAGKGVDQDRDLGALYGLGVIAMLIIYVMIASLLRSYAQPLVIMTAVPFGAAGALIGHFILGFNISFISMFGIIALSGVVVNDSLILIDRYNRYRRETDMDAAEAILAAARRRFRPIILTTVTTALGLTPMLFETSIQAQFLIPMAVSLASGIVFASIIILFLVPALVLIEDDLGMRTG